MWISVVKINDFFLDPQGSSGSLVVPTHSVSLSSIGVPLKAANEGIPCGISEWIVLLMTDQAFRVVKKLW